MFAHHEESIRKLAAYFKDNPSVIAVLLGGSVAKGLERPDSDVDALVVVTPEAYAALERENRLSECIFGHCTYEGGYFDIKYLTAAFLVAAAAKGSEPARNAFLSMRCLFSRDPAIPALAARIPVFQKQEKADKQLSFASALLLNAGYFWDMSQNEPYLRLRATADIVLFGLRLLLEEREVLFPCQKSLLQTVSALSPRPDGVLEAADRLLRAPDDGTKEAFVQAVLADTGYALPDEHAALLTRYVEDNEQWWYKQRPVIAEW